MRRWGAVLVSAGIAQAVTAMDDSCLCLRQHDYWMDVRTHIDHNFLSDADNLDNPKLDLLSTIVNNEHSDVARGWIDRIQCRNTDEFAEAIEQSGCVPGAFTLQIFCLQKELLRKDNDRIMMVVVQLETIGKPALDNCFNKHGDLPWPFTQNDVNFNLMRVRSDIEHLAWAPVQNNTNPSIEWKLGRDGANCMTTCTENKLEYMWSAPPTNDKLGYRASVTKLLVKATGARPLAVAKKAPGWAVHECYFEENGVVYPSHELYDAQFSSKPELRLRGEFQVPGCRLACPCAGAASEYYIEGQFQKIEPPVTEAMKSDDCVREMGKISLHQGFIAEHLNLLGVDDVEFVGGKSHSRRGDLPICSEVERSTFPLFVRLGEPAWKLARAARINDDFQGIAYFIPVLFGLNSVFHLIHAFIPAWHWLRQNKFQKKLARIVFVPLRDDQKIYKTPHLRLFAAIFAPFFENYRGPDSFLYGVQNGYVFDRGFWGVPPFQSSGHHLPPQWQGPTGFAAFQNLALYCVDKPHSGFCPPVRTFAERAVSGFEVERKDIAYGGDGSNFKIVIVQRMPESSEGRSITNVDELASAVQFISKGLELVDAPTMEVVDMAVLSLTEQLQLARSADIWFGAHGDGLTWSMFMQPFRILLEAMSARQSSIHGFSSCIEGWDVNPYSIFGGLAKQAGVAHACWTNPTEQIACTISDDDLADETKNQTDAGGGGGVCDNNNIDASDSAWRRRDIMVDVDKFSYFFRDAIIFLTAQLELLA